MLAEQTVIGKRYVLAEEIGRGGMGAVYRAVDRMAGQPVAIKRVLAPRETLVFNTLSAGTDLRLALAQEFKILASLRHPNILSVLDYGFDADGQPFIVMELLEHAHTLMEAGQGKTPAEQARLLSQVFQALAYLHRRGVLHRDLKPSNVLVLPDEQRVKVVDFGLSVMQGKNPELADSSVSGTLGYMAPEVLHGEPATAASDVYAAGILAYQLLCGEHPFDLSDISRLIKQITYDLPDLSRLNLTPALTLLMERLIAKSPQDRYPDATEALRAYAEATHQPHFRETEATRESFLQAASFVGREAELNQLKTAFDHAAQQRGSIWLIGGESGVGKTRLLDEIRTHALVEGAGVIRGQATSEAQTAYQVWREVARWFVLQLPLPPLEASILKPLVPDIAALMGQPIPDAPELNSQAAQERLLNTLEALFRQQRQPLVILLEDLQWAGSDSLKLLSRLHRPLDTLPILVIASYRDDERADLPAELPGAQVINLRRLDTASIAQLSASMLGAAGQQPRIVEFLQRETEGNVFFLVEVMRVLAETAGNLENIAHISLPTSVTAGGVQQVIERRLDKAGAAAQPFLKLAAIVGRQIDLALLQYAADQGQVASPVNLEDWLTICDNAAVLVVRDGAWWFAHDKLREGLLHDLPLSERQALHQLAARTIEALYPDNAVYIAALAHHYSQTEDRAKAIYYLDKAGEQAAERFANYEAIAFLTQAQPLDQPPTDPTRTMQRENLLGQAYLGAGDLTLSRAHLTHALQLLGHPPMNSQGQIVRGLLGQVIRQTRHRFRLPAPVQTPVQRDALMMAARIYEKISELAYYNSDTLLTLYSVLYTVNLTERLAPSAELARMYANMTIVSGIVGVHRLADLYQQRARHTAEQVQDRATKAQVHSRIAVYQTGVGHWQAAEAGLTLSQELSLQIGNFRQWAEAVGVLSQVAYFQGQFERSRALCQELYLAAQQNQSLQHESWGLEWGSQSDLRLGNFASVRANLEKNQFILKQTALQNDIAGHIIHAGLLTQLYLALGWFEQAQTAADQTMQLLAQYPNPSTFTHIQGYGGAAETYLALWEQQPTPTIQAAAAEACRIFPRLGKRFSINLPRMHTALGHYQFLKGQPAKAHHLWQQAIREATTMQMPYEAARAHYQVARHLPSADPQRAAHIQQALALLTPLKAIPLLEQVQAL